MADKLNLICLGITHKWINSYQYYFHLAAPTFFGNYVPSSGSSSDLHVNLGFTYLLTYLLHGAESFLKS
jgi:hypothetical protein